MARGYAVLGLLLTLALSPGNTSSINATPQSNSLSRNLEPVVLTGAQLSTFEGVAVDELFLYAYDSVSDAWQQVPWQIDEVVTESGARRYFTPDDGVLDADDEFSFMAKDGGDRAENSQWIADENARANQRIEIAVSNPLADGETAWFYLYQSSTLTEDADLQDYVEHVPTQGGLGEDGVQSKFYEIQHGANGFPQNLSITQDGGGNDQDLLDAFKLRALVVLGFEVALTEEQIALLPEQNDEVSVKDGRIRIIRQLDATFSVIRNLIERDFQMPPFFYYPYSFVFDIDIPNITELDPSAELRSGRLSIDLNEQASGMTFVSANNAAPGFEVDGTPDASVDRTIDNQLPANNWSYIGGAQGVLVHLFPLATTVGGSRELYHKDDSTLDDTDTADQRSYGDTGIDVAGGIEPPVTFSYRGYFLGSSFDSSIGAQIAEFEREPLTPDFEAQSYEEPTSVDDGPVLPVAFNLEQNYPNPFNPTTEIRYQIAKTGRTTLAIYNLLGKKVRTLVNENVPAGSYSVSWNGTDDAGRQVTSGVYVYRLQSGEFVESRKLVFVK